MPYKVLVVDDQKMPRYYFAQRLRELEGYELVDAIDSARMADVYCAAGRIDLILMDIVMADGFSGLDAAEKIKRSYPQVKIIGVSSMPDASFLRRAREVGVDSFWYKEGEGPTLAEVMDGTMQGRSIYPQQTPPAALGAVNNAELTDRELDVLKLLASGLSDREIAEKLHISLNTVRYHVGNLLSKSELSSRTELAISAVKTGIVVPGI